MSIVCALVGHSASAKIIRNAGHSFSSCIRCSADLVDVDGKWTAAPAGHRIVWKERAAEAPPPAPVEKPFAPSEAVLELTAPAPPSMKPRTRQDRRTSGNSKPPAYLGGIDRRRGRDRRRAFGKKPVIALD